MDTYDHNSMANYQNSIESGTMSTETDAANKPPRRGSWTWLRLDLADGSQLELRVPGVVGVSAACLLDPLGEAPTISRTTPDGRTRRGRLRQLFDR